HESRNIPIGSLDAEGLQEKSCNDWNKSTAVDLGDLITSARARRTKARWKVLSIEGWDRAVSETKNESEADNLRDHCKNEAAGVHEIEIRQGKYQQPGGGDQKDRAAINEVGEQRADDHKHQHERSRDQADDLGLISCETDRLHVARAENEVEEEGAA